MESFSPVYNRYNGFLLGVFLALAGMKFARPKYPAARARIEEFLKEIGVDIPIPADPESFEKFDPGAVIFAVGERDFELTEFATLGSYGVAGTAAGPAISAAASRILKHHQLDSLVETSDLTAMQAAAGEAVTGNGVISQALRLAARILAPLPVEPDTAFVIMPFASPFAERYSALYRPLLNGLGARAIRGWGGLAEEEYQEAMLRIIGKCGVVLADVTGANPNVMYELGAAQGQGKQAILLMEADRLAVTRRGVPANIGNQRVLAYDPSRPDWERELLSLMGKE